MKKLFLSPIVLAALALSACDSDSPSQPDNSFTPPNSSSAIATPQSSALDGSSSSISISTPTSSSSPETPPAMEVVDWEETPQVCNSIFDGDTVFSNVELKKWTWVETDVFDGKKVHITQKFTGLSASDFQAFCDDEKKDIGINNDGLTTKNVTCSDNTITEEVIMDDEMVGMVTPAVMASTISNVCDYLLNGYATLKDIFFSDEEE